MKTAIVILNYNGKDMLRQYLPTLFACTEGAEVFVADNASTDGSAEMLASEFPQVKVIALDKNYGFAGGYNVALGKTSFFGEKEGYSYYLLLNSDIEVTHGWLKPLEDFMDANPEFAACQPKLRALRKRDEFEYAGASGGFIDKFGYPFCRGRLFDTVEKDEGQYDDTREVMWATGAALMIRREDWTKAGGFDGSFFAHNEEIDLCWRLRLMGRKIAVVPQSMVFHVGGATLSKSNPMKTFLNFRNNLTMLYKNLPDKELKHVMRVRWFLDYVAAWQTLILNRNLGDFKAIYRARCAFRKITKTNPSIRTDARKPVAETLKTSTMLAPYSILTKYYIKGIRKFSQIL